MSVDERDRDGRDQAGLPPGWLVDAVERSSDVAAVLAADTTIEWVSRGARHLLGRAPSEMVGRSIADLVHPDDLARAAEVVGLAADGHFDEVYVTPALYRILHADGTWVHLEVNASPGPDGGLLLVIRRTHDLVVQDQLLEAVTGGRDLDDQLDLVVELGRWRHTTEGYAVLVHDIDGTRRARTAGIGDARLTGLAEVAGPTPWDAALAARAPIVLDELTDRSLVSAEVAAAATDAGFQGVIALPVADPARPEGACLIVWSTKDGPSVAGHRYPTENMERALSLILQWRSHLWRLERAANVDGLTGLATRARFFDLAHVQFAAGATAALYIDLDGFKAVNDDHGHAAGDDVLAGVAERLAAAVGEGVLLGRLGGDEFAALCPPGAPPDEPARLAAAVVDALRSPLDVGGVRVQVGASVGVARRRDGESLPRLLERADAALLAMKAAGKDGWRLAD